MGPLFAFGFLAIAGAASMAVVFLVAKLFLRFWPAVRLAFASTTAGGLATILALYAQAPFYTEPLTGDQPEIYMGTAAAVGALAAIAAGWFSLRRDRQRSARFED